MSYFLLALWLLGDGAMATVPDQPSSAPAEAASPANDPLSLTLMGGTARFSGVLFNRLSTVTSYDHTDKDVFVALDRAQFALDYRAPELLRVYLAARIDWTFSAEGPDQSSAIAAQSLRGSQKTLFSDIIELREAFVDLYSKRIDFRVGNQILTWGQNELVSPIDVLNPLDLRDVLSPELFKLPVLAATANIALSERGSLRLVVEPFFEPSEVPVLGQNFSLIAPGSSIERQLGAALGPVDRTLDSRLSSLVGTSLPDDNPLNSTVAARLQYQVGPFDLAANAIYGWNRLPVAHVDPDLLQVIANPVNSGPTLEALGRLQKAAAANQPIVSAVYTRRSVFGFDGATAIKDFTLKLDVAAEPNTTVYSSAAMPLSLTELSAVFGFDYNYGENFQLGVSVYANDYLQVPAGVVLSTIEPASDLGLHRRQVWQWGAVAFARLLVWDARIELRLSGIFEASVQDGSVLTTATYNINDLHHLVVGGLFLGGPTATLFNYFQRNNEVFFEYRFTF